MKIYRAPMLAAALLAIVGAQPAAASDLTGAAWRPVSIGREKPVARQQVTFDGSGRVFGSDGCNSFSGSYKATGDNGLRIGANDMVSTMRGCLDAHVSKSSQAFLAAVTGARAWRSTGARLYLLDGKGKPLIELRR